MVLVPVEVPLPVMAVLLPVPVVFTVLEGRVLLVVPSMASVVLVPRELMIVPLFVPPVPLVDSFKLLYPPRDSRLP